jgi:hypothetical protein
MVAINLSVMEREKAHSGSGVNKMVILLVTELSWILVSRIIQFIEQ